MGARPRTIIRKLPVRQRVQSVPVIATLNAADAILTLAGLGFLGLGIQPDEAAEWGYDLQRAVADAGAGIWWTALYPGLGIVIAVTALTLVGEGLNDVLNPTLRRRTIKHAGRSSGARSAPRRSARPRRPRRRGGGGPNDRAGPLDCAICASGTAHERGAVRAVDGVSLDLMPGETVGLVGESGCGKSTLGRGVIGLLPESAGHAGEVSYKGRNILDLKPKELRELRGPELGMIFQEPMTRLNPLMKISQHFEEVLQDPRAGARQEGGAQARARGAARHGHPADALRPVPARVLGRHAPADHDRAGARAAARGGRGRRADDRARRARRGPDPAHHRRPAAQLRHRRCC